MLTLFPRIRPNLVPPPAPESLRELQESAPLASDSPIQSAETLSSAAAVDFAAAPNLAAAGRAELNPPENSPAASRSEEHASVAHSEEFDKEFTGFVVKVPDLTLAGSNLYDELEMVDQAVGERAASEPQLAPSSQAVEIERLNVSVDALVDATQAALAKSEAALAETPGSAVPAQPIEMGDWPAESEKIEMAEATPAVLDPEAVAMAAAKVVASAELGPVPTEGPVALQSAAVSSVDELQATAAQTDEIADEANLPKISAEQTASTAPEAMKREVPRKPRRSKESFFLLERVPEPESMDDSGEIEAYASAAAQAHLNAIDDTFVAHAQLLVRGRERGRALDIGTGPGQIVLKLAAKLTRWKFVGVDRSQGMIAKANELLPSAPEVAGRVEFRMEDGRALDFPDSTFDLVICNSVLHHMPDPQTLFAEIARVVKSGGAILLRDLRRPARFEYASHVKRNGRHYTGEMKRLYIASVQAAYTEEELQRMILSSALRDVQIFRHAKTHIGFERKLQQVRSAK